MFKSIGAALGRPTISPNHQPVRRHSYQVGHCEGVFWRRTDRQEVRQIVLAAKRYELTGRTAGRKNGPLGHVAIEALELLANLVSYKTGRLEPSVAFIMERLKRSRDAVVRALGALRVHGFLDRLRRYERIERDGPGPRVRQASNAYRLVMPPRALRLLGVQGRPAPVADDFEHERWMQVQEIAAMKACLPLDELAVLEVEDNRLGKLLAQIGKRVHERESVSR